MKVYKAEGDPWVYMEAGGQFVVIGPDGRPRAVRIGTEADKAIRAQIESGQLSAIQPEESSAPEEVGATKTTRTIDITSGEGGDTVIDTGAPIGGQMDLGAADRATAGLAGKAVAEKRGYGDKRNSILDKIMSGVSSAASVPGEAMGSVRDGIGNGVDAAKEYMAGDEEPEEEDPLADLRAQESIDIKAGQYRRAADRATSGWEDEIMKRKRASQER